MESPVVEISQGKLKGCVRKDHNGKDFLAFMGIPFAKPPLGELRFKEPHPPEPWEGVKMCATESVACYQKDLYSGKFFGSEDCLYLNLFTKSVAPDQLKPVFVYIHGGAFVSGSNDSNRFGPEFLITEDIVLVTVNYRLGMLGFLSLEDLELEVPGNAGLKDQTMALSWVQQNIEMFGGDPNQVTLGGVSAGGISAHLHTMSQLSENLFQKAIMQSGLANSVWTITQNNIVEILDAAGEEVNDEREALELLRTLPVENVYSIQEKYMKSRGHKLIVFGPVIEKPHPGAFITEDPNAILEAAKCLKIPMMIGFCDREGLLISVLKTYQPERRPFLEEPCETRLIRDMKLNAPDEFFMQWGRMIREFYFESGNPEGETLFNTDLYFMVPAVLSAEFHARASSSPVFLYEFSVDAGLNIGKLHGNITDPGACHTDDVGYLFRVTLNPNIEEGSFEETVMRRCVKLFTNFVKWSDPTPTGYEFGVKWPPVGQENAVNYLEIGKTLKVDKDLAPERMELWKGLLESLKAAKNMS